MANLCGIAVGNSLQIRLQSPGTSPTPLIHCFGPRLCLDWICDAHFILAFSSCLKPLRTSIHVTKYKLWNWKRRRVTRGTSVNYRQKFKHRHLVNKIGRNDIAAFKSIHNHYVTGSKSHEKTEWKRPTGQGERWLFSRPPCPIKQWQVIAQTNCNRTYLRHSGVICAVSNNKLRHNWPTSLVRHKLWDEGHMGGSANVATCRDILPQVTVIV